VAVELQLGPTMISVLKINN